MDCAACAITIEKGLSKLKDIAEVKVNFSTAKLQVAASNADAFIPIETEIKKLGYSVEPLNEKENIKTFDIQGMDCGSCAKSIENHLNHLPSVKNVSVNFSTGKMKIEHSGSVEEIIAEVSKIGYKASLQSNKKSIQTNKNINENGLVKMNCVPIALGFTFVNNALAHTGLESSSPQNGDIVNEELQQITLTFEAKIEQGSTFELQNSNGDSIPVENISISENQMVGNFSNPLENRGIPSELENYWSRWSSH